MIDIRMASFGVVAREAMNASRASAQNCAFSEPRIVRGAP